MAQSLAAGRRVTLPQVGLFADGVAVKQVGEETFRLVPRAGRRDGAGRHRRDLRGDQGRLRGHALDPRAGRRARGRRGQGLGGAAPRAGPHAGGDRLRREHELRPPALRRRARRAGRAARGDPRRDDPRAPGQLPGVLRPDRAPLVTEFNYRYADPDDAHVFVGLEVAGREETAALAGASSSAAASRPSTSPTTRWRSCTCATWSAATRPPAQHEILYRFEFPERPGALMQFLDSDERAAGTSACSTTATTARTTAACWSACRCRRRTRPSSAAFSTRLGYDYVDETANPAYRLFLGR